MNNLKKWCAFQDFLEDFKPFTPYGKYESERLSIINEYESLEKEYDNNQILIDFLRNLQEENLARLTWHLGRIPFLDDIFIQNSSDIFIVKKYLFNLRNICDIIGEEICERFRLIWDFDKIYKMLEKGGGNIESFHLSSSYSKTLRTIRKKIQDLDDEIKEEKNSLFEKLKEKYGLDFFYRDFILIDHEKIELLKICENIYIESYDSENFLVKPVFSSEILDNIRKKDELTRLENIEENEIIGNIRDLICDNSEKLKETIKALAGFDIVLARVLFMKKHNMNCRPEISSRKGIKVKKGCFIPLMINCTREDLSYYELDIDLKTSIGVIRGSNMGGKTIVLKTIAFMQLIAQCGFFVNAERFETFIYDNIVTLSELSENNLSGLSSFGSEINNLIKLLGKEGNTLVLIDEFARTTNSDEAFALLCGLIEYFGEKDGLTAFFSTHFQKIPDLNEVSTFRMKGLDHDRFRNEYSNDIKRDLRERINLINSFMEYVIIEDRDQRLSFDALNVADILGLDRNIIECSRKYMGRHNEK